MSTNKTCVDVQEINDTLDEGKKINFEEVNNTFQKVESQANDIFGDILTALQKAKHSINNSIPESEELEEKSDEDEEKVEDTKDIIEDDQKVTEDIAEFTKNLSDGSQNRRKHISTQK